MNNFYSIPSEYEALIFLHSRLGDIQTVDCFCALWNHHNPGDTLRYKSDDGIGTIKITGKCSDLEEALKICRYITTLGVAVVHEPTRLQIDLEY